MEALYYITRSNIPGQGKTKFYLAKLGHNDYLWFTNKHDATKFLQMEIVLEENDRKGTWHLYELEPV
jgi:hypothetical protein